MIFCHKLLESFVGSKLIETTPMKDKHVTFASEPQEIRISWIEKQKARNAPKRFFRIFVISSKRI